MDHARRRRAFRRADKHRVHQPLRRDSFARTELFFGSARAAGEVTEAEFKQFLDVFITPRFPDGLTLLTGHGQFLGSKGPVRERSFLLILLYPAKALDENRKARHSLSSPLVV